MKEIRIINIITEVAGINAEGFFVAINKTLHLAERFFAINKRSQTAVLDYLIPRRRA